MTSTTPLPMGEPVLLEPDDRGRISLGKLGKLDARYLGTMTDDGVIILEPAEVVSRRDMEHLAAARGAARGKGRPKAEVFAEMDAERAQRGTGQ